MTACLLTDKRVEYLDSRGVVRGGGAEMITPSKEESKEECGTRVEVSSNSDILELFLNTDRGGGRLILGLSENVNAPRASLAASVQTLSRRQSFLYMHSIKCRPG